jgi:hypothetical protein
MFLRVQTCRCCRHRARTPPGVRQYKFWSERVRAVDLHTLVDNVVAIIGLASACASGCFAHAGGGKR